MNGLLSELLSLRKMEYLAVDRKLNILETSIDAKRFADCPQEVRQGNPVCLGFPELIGIEELLIAILEGRQRYFELKGIGRFAEQNSPLYIDLYVISNRSQENAENQLILFFEDVTERMVLEQKLVQAANEVSLLLEAWDSSNEYFTKILQSLADALFVTTQSGTIKLVNQAAKNLLGYSEKDLLGKPLYSIIPDYQLLLEAGKRYLLSQNFLHNVEVVGLAKNGMQVAIAFSCSAIQPHRETLPDFIYLGRKIAKG
jgi:PAS domain S-box-containing protein